MNTITADGLSFLEWTKKVSAQHSNILGHMRESTDLLDRVIAKRIIQTAEGAKK